MTRPLRFCHLTTFYPPYNFGGDGIGIQRLARALVGRGHHCTVVHDADAYNMLSSRDEPDASWPTEPYTDAGGVEVVPLTSGLGAGSCVLTQQTGHPVINGKRLRKLLDEGQFDVINYHNVSLIGGPGIWALGDAVKLQMAHEHWLVCESHTLWRHGKELCDLRECVRCVASYKRPPQLWRRTGMIKRYGKHVDGWIAMSEFSRAKHAEFELPFEMDVLPYFLPEPEAGADPEQRPRFDPDDPEQGRPQERPYFLFVGRLEQIKGLQDVIPLFREYRDADLLITGTGEYERELRALADGLDNVRFLGRIPYDDLMRTYRHAEALIVPSICFETFGIILIEAFTNGIPVIARRLGPFPEIVEGSGGGELFSDSGELLAAMRRIRGDSSHRDRLADNGWRAYCERWTESAVIPRYLELVRRAALRGGRDEIADAIGPGKPTEDPQPPRATAEPDSSCAAS